MGFKGIMAGVFGLRVDLQLRVARLGHWGSGFRVSCFECVEGFRFNCDLRLKGLRVQNLTAA